MKIFATSDIHGNKKIINRLVNVYENSEAELLLICGDIGGKGYQASSALRFGRQQRQDYDYLVAELKKCTKPFCCILGNDDWFDAHDDYCLSSGETVKFFGDIVAFDFVKITPFNTNRESNENKIAYELEKIAINENSIIMAHCPPYKAQDKIYSGENVGSKSIRECIENIQPKIWFCGHIHEDFGVSEIGKTLVINCACSHLQDALRGVIIDTDNLHDINYWD
jgi:Icc-related predicted phosphoesterase